MILLQENKQDDCIIALTTQVQELTQKMTSKSKNKNSMDASQGDKCRRQQPWTCEKPKDGEPHTKTVNGKAYTWCEGNSGKHHRPKWVWHKYSECIEQNNKSRTPSSRNAPPTLTTTTPAAPQSVGWSAAMHATIDPNE